MDLNAKTEPKSPCAQAHGQRYRISTPLLYKSTLKVSHHSHTVMTGKCSLHSNGFLINNMYMTVITQFLKVFRQIYRYIES